MGDPRVETTTLGPVVSLRSAANIRAHIAEARTSLTLNSPHRPPTNDTFYLVSKGAKALIPESHFPMAKEGTTYLAPQVLIDVDHSMLVMMEESFGPVVGIMKVRRSSLSALSC